jgi:hypothetical protein
MFEVRCTMYEPESGNQELDLYVHPDNKRRG